MQLTISNSAIVVLAQQHNPTILHPSFLVSQQIVPDNWELLQPPICLPPFANVKYKNGIDFMAEQNKLQVLDNNTPSEPEKSELPRIVKKYLQNLPHVRYTAVGINFQACLEKEDPALVILNRFMKSEVITQSVSNPEALGLALVVSFPPFKLRYNCDSGQVTPEQKQVTGVLLTANYHTDLDGAQIVKSASEAIDKFGNCYNHLVSFTKEFFGES